MEDAVTGFRILPIAGPLLAWYRGNARKLPWRENTDAYRVWISEIMLQQTRVEAVKPYYERFLNALPDAAALSRVPDETLMKLWEGLGYYSRARSLKAAAQKLMRDFGGTLPASYEELLTLPGIGPYTAGAIASIAYGVPVPAVDGNVLRVLARLSDCDLDIARPDVRKLAGEAAAAMLPPGDPGAFNQALMELGACVCLPNAEPKCLLCPVRGLCAGFAAGTAASLPVKTKKAPRRVEERTVFALWDGERFAVRRRDERGLLGGLWELPNVPGHLSGEALAAQLAAWGAAPIGALARYERKHIFTHIEWRMRVYSLPAALDPLPEGWEWAGEQSPHALPAAFRVCLPR